MPGVNRVANLRQTNFQEVLLFFFLFSFFSFVLNIVSENWEDILCENLRGTLIVLELRIGMPVEAYGGKTIGNSEIFAIIKLMEMIV